jgi:two-component sensor histidine kinase
MEEKRMADQAPVGLPGIDGLPWGSHICHFYPSADRLREVVVPYLKAGLENDERCLLVAKPPFGAEDARCALRAAIGDFDRRELAKQIEIHDVAAWHDPGGAIDGARMMEGLLRSEEQARADGYRGFRTNSNLGWVGREQWSELQDYEVRVSRGLKGRRAISLCSYCFNDRTPQDVLDVVCHHDATIGSAGGRWLITAVGGDEYARRTAAEQRLSLVVQELEHRIKNSLATVQALAGSTMRGARTLDEFDKTFRGRIGALSRTHSILTDGHHEQVGLRQLLDNELGAYADQTEQRVSLSGPDVVLAARLAMSFGMALHELTTNAVKHGALSPEGGTLEILWRTREGTLEFDWVEHAAAPISSPTRTGFGTQLLNRVLAHQHDATVELIFDPDGLRAKIVIPAT